MSDDESMTARGFSPLEDIACGGFPEELLREHELPHLVTTESLQAGLSGGMLEGMSVVQGHSHSHSLPHPKPKGRRTGRGPVKEKNLKVPKIAKQPKLMRGDARTTPN